MKTYHLQREITLAQPIKEVFAFFKRPENLEQLTPPNLNFQILTPSPISMKKNAQIEYRIHIFGIWKRWTTLITEYDPPHRFVDEQLKGPYAFWRHIHTFMAVPQGTLIRDEVHYALPFGFVGQIAHRLIVKNQLKAIFNYRTQAIQKIFSV